MSLRSVRHHNRDEFNHAAQGGQPNGGRERQLDRSAEVAGRQLIHEQGEVIGGQDSDEGKT